MLPIIHSERPEATRNRWCAVFQECYGVIGRAIEAAAAPIEVLVVVPCFVHFVDEDVRFRRRRGNPLCNSVPPNRPVYISTREAFSYA
jgi:hypothetical protein